MVIFLSKLGVLLRWKGGVLWSATTHITKHNHGNVLFTQLRWILVTAMCQRKVGKKWLCLYCYRTRGNWALALISDANLYYEQMRLICSELSYIGNYGYWDSWLGFEGRKHSLNSLSCTHSNRWCSTVSSWQVDDVLTPISLRWLLSGMCLVLSWKIMDWSPLLSLLIGSLSFGLFIWVCMGLLMFDAAQVLIISTYVEPPSKSNDLGVFEHLYFFPYFHCIHIEQCIL